jgi:hypothetical protein
MNKDLTAEQQALVADLSKDALASVKPVDPVKQGVFADNGGFGKKYPSIITGGAFEISYHFVPEYTVDGEMKLYCWNEDTYAKADQLTAENADSVMSMNVVDGEYVGKSGQVVAKDLDKTVYAAAVYETDGVVYCTGVLPYSIAAFCMSNSDALADAIAVYGCAAQALLGK